MKARYYVRQGISVWLVLDRDKIRMNNDIIATLPSRSAARAKAKALNDETARDRRADQELTVDGGAT